MRRVLYMLVLGLLVFLLAGMAIMVFDKPRAEFFATALGAFLAIPGGLWLKRIIKGTFHNEMVFINGKATSKGKLWKQDAVRGIKHSMEFLTVEAPQLLAELDKYTKNRIASIGGLGV